MKNAIVSLVWIAIHRNANSLITPLPNAVIPSSLSCISYVLDPLSHGCYSSKTSTVILHAVPRQERYARTIFNRGDSGNDRRSNNSNRNNSWGNNRSGRGRMTNNNDNRRSFGGRRDDIRYDYQRSFGGRNEKNKYGSKRSFGGRNGGKRHDNNYGLYYDPYDGGPIFGNSDYYPRQGSSEDFRRSSSNPRYQRSNYDRDRIQDYYTPGERERRQQRQNDGARYGWQQQYDVERGNVRRGSSSENFRRGKAFDRVQDYMTPREREQRQQRQNQGARYGWQQQYNTDRGNVRAGSSNDFRRGREYDGYRDFMTPRERERMQRLENRAIGQRWEGSDYIYDNEGDYSFVSGAGRGYSRRNDGYNDYRGRNDGYGYDYGGEGGQRSYYEPEIVRRSSSSNGYGRSGQASGRRLRNSWENLRNVFKF